MVDRRPDLLTRHDEWILCDVQIRTRASASRPIRPPSMSCTGQCGARVLGLGDFGSRGAGPAM
jgi:hypothetical protein